MRTIKLTEAEFRALQQVVNEKSVASPILAKVWAKLQSTNNDLMLPVEVQRPNQPQSTRVVGAASDELTAEEVAKQVGVPDGHLIEGKILGGKKGRRWSLVANVNFR
jgi:hypothetical protein